MLENTREQEQYLDQFIKYIETLKSGEEILISRADYYRLSAVKNTDGEYLVKVPTVLLRSPDYERKLEKCKNLPNLLGIRILFSDNPKFKLYP